VYYYHEVFGSVSQRPPPPRAALKNWLPQQCTHGCCQFSRCGRRQSSVYRQSITLKRLFLVYTQWEERKAWDVLLEAFYTEFDRAEGVLLYLLTNAYHNEGTDFSQLVEQLKMQVAETSGRTVDMLPIVEMIETRVPQQRLPSLFAAMDGFVLPSRGEGWGRPHVRNPLTHAVF
jgi:glycosyltransferase involved in cell wall biosynthesis